VLREQSTTWFADLVKLPQAHVLNGHVEVCGHKRVGVAVLEIPQIVFERGVTGPARGRTISEAESTARQMVALATGVRIDDIAVRAVGLAAPTAAFRPGGRAARRPAASSAPA